MLARTEPTDRLSRKGVGEGDSTTQPPPQAPNASKEKTPPGGFVDRWWHARLWLGFSFGSWWRLLRVNRFAISPHRWAAAVFITFVSAGHSCFRLLQWLIFRGRVERAEIADGPVFIIGHWRSGTTLLHELLAQDPRYAYPTNYQCFAPQHFLLSEWICKRLFRFLLPSQRPMDNMAVGWDRPQEDEFALCALGEPSPYLKLAFPDRLQCQEYLDFVGVPPEALDRWKRTLRWFVKLIAYKHDGKTIILKSPTHTGRMQVLGELFPKARFIHIVRNPYVLYQSTVNMWTKMYQTQHMRTPRQDEGAKERLGEYVFGTLNQMYAAFEAARPKVPPNRLYEIRYEDLVADPIGQLRRIYAQLELGDFTAALPGVQAYLAETGDYQTNRYEISPELKSEIRRRWAGYVERYGYE
jgi:LPS sulfotransferase NodH